MHKTKLSGFTLIELLLVIVIIGVLSLALLPTILEGPKKARDASRKVGVLKIQNALMKYVDVESGDTESAELFNEGDHGCASDFGFISEMLGEPIPKDPEADQYPANPSGGSLECNALGEYVIYINPYDADKNIQYRFGVYARLDTDTQGNATCGWFGSSDKSPADIQVYNDLRDCFVVLIK